MSNAVHIAHIFRGPSGTYYVNNFRQRTGEVPHYDRSGPSWGTRLGAMLAALDLGYTHACGTGTYWAGVEPLKAQVARWTV